MVVDCYLTVLGGADWGLDRTSLIGCDRVLVLVVVIRLS